MRPFALRSFLVLFTLSSASLAVSELFAQEPTAGDSRAEQLEFFETRIRPVLAEHCYSCHNSTETAEADLALDFREGTRAVTEHGTVVSPGKPRESLLLKVIRHEVDGLEMPDGGVKLDATVIADFERWVSAGAIDPRDKPPTAEALAVATSWETKLEKRKQWWSFQPIRQIELPADATHPIDAFVRKRLQAKGLTPAERADAATLLRRLTFVITGLPPTEEQLAAFSRIESAEQYGLFVDELLSSDAFGERWARHFMDLVRYSDSHGSEGDPTIPHAYRYRDYLIRALNADVGYDQLVREHIAGDLLPVPRLNEELGINESAIGPAHWRMVFHGFAPTDALDEKVRFVDDQINVFSKAFLGLTVSCARCHDHKFDAISQADYYALFGVLASCRPALIDANSQQRQLQHQQRMRSIKLKLRAQISTNWDEQFDELRETLRQAVVAPDEVWKKRLADAKEQRDLLNLWQELRKRTEQGKSFAEAWQSIANEWQEVEVAEAADRRRPNRTYTDFSKSDQYRNWFATGNGLPPNPYRAGDFSVASDGEQVIAHVFPAGIHTASLTDKHRGFLASPKLRLDGDYRVYFRVAGDKNPSARYSVQHYPRNGTVYPIRSFNHTDWRFLEYDLRYWNGDDVHFEVATARDAPVQVRNDESSWFGIRELIVRDRDAPKPVRNAREFLKPVFDSAKEAPPQSAEAFADLMVTSLRDAVVAWRDRSATDAQALLIDRFVSAGLLCNEMSQLGVESLVNEFRELEQKVPEPYRVPGLAESTGASHPLFTRGDHRLPAEPVSRRFLEAIDDQPIVARESGRLELADKVLDPANPLTTRVIVNRVWHYVFGAGLVTTPDNFGRLGDTPSHPELLDYLACQFVKEGWSIKRAIKLMVTSDAWCASVVPSARAGEFDPDNRLWSHAQLRRLDAEAIRDSLLSVTGELNDTKYGPTVAANKMSDRRSVYVSVRRNSLDQFLHAFDAPVPFSTKGRRDATNVPAQSLTLLNAPFVRELAAKWAAELASQHDEVGDDVGEAVLVENVLRRALGRNPSELEVARLVSYRKSVEQHAKRMHAEREEWERTRAIREKRLALLVDPIRERLVGEQRSAANNESAPIPVVHWLFSEGLTDQVLEVEGALEGGAKLDSGAVVVRGDGNFKSPTIDKPLAEKTIVGTVRLETLEQRGSGVVSVQSPDGVRFDAIVFGERQPLHWIAGSDSFRRTDDLGGPAETADSGELHLAIAYDKDGTIRFYRNGKPYGRPSEKSELQTYKAGEWQVLVGLRHANTGRLRGDVLSAAVYDRALSADEIAALANGANYVSQANLLAAMSDAQRAEYETLRREISDVEEKLETLGEPPLPGESWRRLVHAVFNMKEFIYLR